MPISDAATHPPGTIVIVPFPYPDRLAEKRRPAVVVSGTTVARAGFVWIAMITSARNPSMDGDLPILDLAESGLAVASVVRPIKIACIEPSRILRTVGMLRPTVLVDLCWRIRGMVGSERPSA